MAPPSIPEAEQDPSSANATSNSMGSSKVRLLTVTSLETLQPFNRPLTTYVFAAKPEITRCSLAAMEKAPPGRPSTVTSSSLDEAVILKEPLVASQSLASDSFVSVKTAPSLICKGKDCSTEHPGLFASSALKKMV